MAVADAVEWHGDERETKETHISRQTAASEERRHGEDDEAGRRMAAYRGPCGGAELPGTGQAGLLRAHVLTRASPSVSPCPPAHSRIQRLQD